MLPGKAARAGYRDHVHVTTERASQQVNGPRMLSLPALGSSAILCLTAAAVACHRDSRSCTQKTLVCLVKSYVIA